MKLNKCLLAAALASAAFAAQSENFNPTISLVANASTPGAYSGAFGVTHLVAGAFTDTYSFSAISEPSFNLSSVISTTGFIDSANIDFTSLTINGSPFTLTNQGQPGPEIGSFGLTTVGAPLELVVTGIAAPLLAAGTAIAASYAGTANIAPLSPIPEMHTWALMLAGLGVIGTVTRRRLPR